MNKCILGWDPSSIQVFRNPLSPFLCNAADEPTNQKKGDGWKHNLLGGGNNLSTLALKEHMENLIRAVDHSQPCRVVKGLPFSSVTRNLKREVKTYKPTKQRHLNMDLSTQTDFLLTQHLHTDSVPACSFQNSKKHLLRQITNPG